MWRRVEKVGRKAGESLSTMMDIGTCECGGQIVVAPPNMAKEFLHLSGSGIVELPTECGPMAYVSSGGMRPAVCDRCHEFYAEDIREPEPPTWN